MIFRLAGYVRRPHWLMETMKWCISQGNVCYIAEFSENLQWWMHSLLQCVECWSWRAGRLSHCSKCKQFCVRSSILGVSEGHAAFYMCSETWHVNTVWCVVEETAEYVEETNSVFHISNTTRLSYTNSKFKKKIFKLNMDLKIAFVNFVGWWTGGWLSHCIHWLR